MAAIFDYFLYWILNFLLHTYSIFKLKVSKEVLKQ